GEEEERWREDIPRKRDGSAPTSGGEIGNRKSLRAVRPPPLAVQSVVRLVRRAARLIGNRRRRRAPSSTSPPVFVGRPAFEKHELKHHTATASGRRRPPSVVMHLEMHCQQKDLTIQQLRDQVGQDNVALQIPSAERLLELQRQFADKERLLQESQAQVCLKLHEAEDKISQLESALEHTQCELLKARGKSDTNGSRSDEMEMLMTDLERANQ
ncbi:hypothetical protein HPB47_011575, partial [Ixodes persulcatus]